MRILEIYLLLELKSSPKRHIEILKAMSTYQVYNTTSNMLVNLQRRGMLNKGDWYTLTELGIQTLESHIDKILSKL